MKRTRHVRGHPQFTRRLWTCDPETRDLLVRSPGDLEGALLQHPRIADSVEKQDDDDDNARRRRFRISTETRDRHGDVVRSRGILLKHFRKNPVVLFAHDARQPPIGKARKVEVGDGVVDADVEFFDRETFDFADTIFRIVQADGLRATSIGFMPIDFERLENDEGEEIDGIDFKKVDLLEFSVVPVPANPEAVGRAVKDGAAMQPYLQWLEDMQDNHDALKGLLADLDIGEEHLQAVRRAADGGRILVPSGLPSSGGGDPASLARRNLRMISDGNVEETIPIVDDDEDSEPGELTLERDDQGGLHLVGDAPAKAQFTRGLVEGTESDRVIREGDTITVQLDAMDLAYEIEDEQGDSIIATLASQAMKGPISFRAAHPDGTPAQAKDTSWDASREIRNAEVSDLLVMSTWRQDKPRDELTKSDFKLPHHVASGQHAVNFRGTTAAIAALNGARGGVDIPDNDRRPVWNHLARHIRSDFDEEPPELRWADVEPLKNFPELFAFDEETCTLLVWCALDKTYINADLFETPERRDDGTIVIGERDDIDADKAQEIKQGGFVIQSVAGRKKAWESRQAFLDWAKEHDFKTDKVDSTKTFWRLRQRDPEDFERFRTICINPNDESPNSENCRVQAIGGPLKQAEAEAEPAEADDDLMAMAYQTAAAARTRDIRAGAYGTGLWDNAVSRLTRFEGYFAINGGAAKDIGDEQPNDIHELDGAVNYARIIEDNGLGASKAMALDAADRDEAERNVQQVAEAQRDPEQLIVLGEAVGRRGMQTIYRDCVAYRWVGSEAVRIPLGADMSDPVYQLCELAQTVHKAGRVLSQANEGRLRQALNLLSEVLDQLGGQESDDEDEDDDKDLSPATADVEATLDELLADDSNGETDDDDVEVNDLLEVVDGLIDESIPAAQREAEKQAQGACNQSAQAEFRRATGVVD